MRYHKLQAMAFALATLTSASAVHAQAPERMMQECRIRAHEVLHTRLPDIETKYEGQRTDGTHAVNGTAFVRGRTETFQCSFGPRGRRIVQFVVNHPSHGQDGQASQLPEREPTTRTVELQIDRETRGTEVRDRLGSGDSVRYILRGRNRQFLYVHLVSRNPRVYFNIFRPDNGTLYESAIAGNEYRGQLFLNGEHVIEVYSRSPRAADFNLVVGVER